MEIKVQPAEGAGPPLPGPLDLLDVARASPLASVLCSLDRPGFPLLWANDAFAALTGHTVPDLVVGGWKQLDGDAASPVSASLANALLCGGASVIDAALARNGAPPVACRLYLSPVPGRPLILVQAVESGRAGTPTADTLLRDLRHRVMNHLQFILSVLHMQSLRVGEEPTREALRDIAARIDTLAVVYRQLYATRTDSRIELSGYLGQLVSNLSAFYDRDGRIALMVDAPETELLLPVERAFPLGLVVTELVVNSFKHAFHGREGGTIGIAITRPDAASAMLEVRDDGPGLPESSVPGTGKRLGLTLIRSLVAQIGGTIAMESGDGARVLIMVPLEG